MSEEEIESAIKEIIEENNLEITAKSRGMIMKMMLSKYAGKTDGKTVNAVVGKLLK